MSKYYHLVIKHGIVPEPESKNSVYATVRFSKFNFQRLLTCLEKFDHPELNNVRTLLKKLILNKDAVHYQESPTWRLRMQRPKEICLEARMTCMVHLCLELFKVVSSLQEQAKDDLFSVDPPLRDPEFQSLLSFLRAAIVDFFHYPERITWGNAETREITNADNLELP